MATFRHGTNDEHARPKTAPPETDAAPGSRRALRLARTAADTAAEQTPETAAELAGLARTNTADSNTSETSADSADKKPLHTDVNETVAKARASEKLARQVYPSDLPSAGPAIDRTGTVKLPASEDLKARQQMQTHTDTTPKPDKSSPSTEISESATSFAQLTTMRVGGKFAELLIARTSDELVQHAQKLWQDDKPWLILGGGSNTIVSDSGFSGTVLLVRNTGIETVADNRLEPGQIRVRAQAGQDWDELVAWTVSKGYAGIEMLSGIPGLAGAAPVQNIGAYGGELSQVLHSITCLDRYTGTVRRIQAADLKLSYRDSILKQGYEAIVLSIDLVLTDNSAQDVPNATPIMFAQLANALQVRLGARVPLKKVRDTVLKVRAAKGMVLAENDHNSWSAGSFFTNPIVSEKFARTLPEQAPKFAMDPIQQQDLITTFAEIANGTPLRLPDLKAARTAGAKAAEASLERFEDSSNSAPQDAEPRVKLSAAWLIEHAGIKKGFRLPGSGAAISDLHTLAITNRGGATAADVAELARYVVTMVQTEFGVRLVPEPNIYGLEI